MKIPKFRWIICGLLFAITAINYMDRQIIALLKPQLEGDFGWSEIDYSNIVAVFQFAYAVGSVLMGIFIDKIGVRRGMAMVAFFWSLATAAHAFVCEFDIFGITVSATIGFMIARVGLGLFESGNFPASVRSVATWFPRSEVALANGFFNSGSNVGAIVAPVIVPVLALALGWRMSFFVLGVLGIVWILFWLLLYSAPEKSKYITKGELKHINSNAGEPEKSEEEKPISFWELLKRRQIYAFAVGTAIASPVWFFYLFWMPTFLNRQFNLSIAEQTPYLVLIYLMACVGSVGGGWISSSLLKRGKSLNFSRKMSLFICAFLVCPVFFAPHTSSAVIAALLVGLAGASHQGFLANLYALISDVAPKNSVATITGFGTMCAAATSIAASKSIGYILESANGNYTLIFAFASISYLFAAVLIHMISPHLKKMW